MTAPDSSMTFSLAPGETPLGIQQPFLPATPLGQSLVQAKFLTPLGVRSLTVLEPAVFRSTEPSTTVDWQSPFQESPFFDAPEPPSATNLPTQPPTLQTRSLDSTSSVDWSTASSRAAVEAPPVLNLQRSESPIASPALTSPSVDRSSAFIDPIGLATAFADEAAEPLVEMSALDGADAIETRASSDAATNQATADQEAEQPIGRTLPASDPVASPTPTTASVLQRRTEGNQPPAESKTLLPPIAPTQADDRIALAPIAVEPVAGASSERPLPKAVTEPVSLDDEAAVSLPSPAVNEPTETAATALTVPTSTAPIVASVLPAPPSSPSATEASAPSIARLVAENFVTESSAPSIARLVSENTVTEASAPPIAQSNSEPSVPPIQLRPDGLPVETTATPETTQSQSHLEAVAPDVSVPETSAAIAPVVPEPFPAASNPQTVSDSTLLDPTPLDPTSSIATAPDATPSTLPAIALFPLEDATAPEDTTAPEPIRADSVVQPSPAAPTVIPPIASVAEPEALLSETLFSREMPTRSDSVVQPSPAAPTVIPAIAPVAEPEIPLSASPLPEEAFPASLVTPPNRPEPASEALSDVRLHAAPVDTNLVSELPTTKTLQAKREPNETVERMVGHPVDRVNDISESVQMKLAADATREDRSDVVQRNPNQVVTDEQTAEFRAPDSIEPTLDNELLEATAVASTAGMQSDRSVEPAVAPSIITQTEAQTNQPYAAATAPLLERAQLNEPSIAGNVDLSRSRLAPLTTSALDSEVLALDSPSQADTPTSSVQLDRIEAPTPPLIQPKAKTEPLIQPIAETSAAPAIAPQPTISDVTSAAVPKDDSETSPLPTTEPSLNLPTLDLPTSLTQTSGMAMEAVQRKSAELNEPAAPLNTVAEVPETVSSEVAAATPSAVVPKDDSETSPLSTPEPRLNRSTLNLPTLNLPTLNLPTSPTQTSGIAMESVQRKPAELDAIALDTVAEVPETVSPKAVLPEAVASNQFSALPELPTTIQRLSVWEPLLQLQPLVASVASPAMPPVQTTRYPDVATSLSQTVDRAADPLTTAGLDRFNPVLPSNVSSFNDVVSLKTEAAPAEWSSIAELFQSTEASQPNEPQSNTLQPDATLTNGYTDLNLRPDNTARPDLIQREPEASPAIAGEATPTPDAEPTSGQPSPPSQPQTPQASPEQLERLAQEIYKLVRQRLAVERERGGNLYSRRSI